MGGFFLAAKRGGTQADVLADKARSQFRASGLGEPVRIDDPAYVLDYYPQHERSAENLVRFADGDFIASTGTLICGKCRGAEALRLIWGSEDPEATVADCRGHFAVLIRRSGQTRLLRDALSVYEVYHDEDLSIISTSFLALARCLAHCSIRPAECLEYLLNGVTFGVETPIREIRRLDFGDAIAVTPIPRILRRTSPLLPEEASASFASQLRCCIAVLSEFTENFADAFAGQVRVGFSGGYDSRLILAFLRKHGVTPSLFVYGAISTPDVQVAKEIATQERIPLEHVDKNLFRPLTPESFPEMVRQNFHWNDGFSQFGIFSSDAENIVRAERSRPPGVVLNGGGGEVFRNYYKFCGSALSVRDCVRNFFSPIDPKILVDPRLYARFESGLVQKIAALLRLDRDTLTRRQIEALYPHLRCHSWFARANSIDTRFGDVVLPYYDRRVVDTSLSLPLRWKHFGNFESRLIRELDPALASYRSSHGFGFARNTPLKGMLPDLLLYALPPPIRRYNYRIKRRLLQQPARRQALSEPFLATAVDPKFPITSRFFRRTFVTDNAQLNRLATLEYLFEELNADASNEAVESVR